MGICAQRNCTGGSSPAIAAIRACNPLLHVDLRPTGEPPAVVAAPLAPGMDDVAIRC